MPNENLAQDNHETATTPYPPDHDWPVPRCRRHHPERTTGRMPRRVHTASETRMQGHWQRIDLGANHVYREMPMQQVTAAAVENVGERSRQAGLFIAYSRDNDEPLRTRSPSAGIHANR